MTENVFQVRLDDINTKATVHVASIHPPTATLRCVIKSDSFDWDYWVI
jgi:hypothetical protein